MRLEYFALTMSVTALVVSATSAIPILGRKISFIKDGYKFNYKAGLRKGKRIRNYRDIQMHINNDRLRKENDRLRKENDRLQTELKTARAKCDLYD